MTFAKTSDRWPMQLKLKSEMVMTGQWESPRWSLDDLLPGGAPQSGYDYITLELHKDQRSAYRFNLNSTAPCLFLLCNEDETDNQLTPLHLTASQDEASSYMDGEHQVMSFPMPPAVQCWIESYLGLHGELIEMGRKKKRKGGGRSSGN
ncbi:DUF3305 domain-containing protein [Neptunomonas concharum]|uniref:DUF3305 domain-containing protein n=1 Tax=Neptunomonas concharum TaxID=1031538 RepID=A0A5P1RE84_9GAMM|nr:DUF3305 domain-containing protein [Neptunomonas concharum]QEQ97917.1 DUF3305 domain-containing protein [Neptunomonas concharum]